ncbi:MAG: 30S ribosomal protein S19e [Nitrospiraceae bacterium]|nr:30S ribosomal protein S19e [Nitrospiraceae bacterium]
MTTAIEVKPNELIEALADRLREMIKEPDWANFVKTGVSKERLPQKGWWYIRAASILRTVYLNGPIGISKLRNKYGSKKNRGAKPEHFYRASGSHIRKILQELEEQKLVEQKKDGIHKGRVITKEGEKLINDTIKEIIKKDSSKSKEEVSKKSSQSSKANKKEGNKVDKAEKKEKDKGKKSSKKVKKSGK